jgi:hypothetical protein
MARHGATKNSLNLEKSNERAGMGRRSTASRGRKMFPEADGTQFLNRRRNTHFYEILSAANLSRAAGMEHYAYFVGLPECVSASMRTANWVSIQLPRGMRENSQGDDSIQWTI